MKFSNSPEVPDGYILIGKIIGAHGIRGAIKVYSYAESADHFAPPGDVHLVDPQGRMARYRILSAQTHKQVVRLDVEGIDTREAAQALTGWQVCLARSKLPALEADTYYWSDLIGMTVVDEADAYLGRVVQIIPTGANDVYVVETPADNPVGEILVPAIASVVLDIDIDRRRMRVSLPDGLI